MLAPEPLRGVRVVADPAALDALAAGVPPGATLLRFAPDEALLIDAGLDEIRVADPHAIVEPEAGFVAITLDLDVVARHTDWHLPEARLDGSTQPAQGAIAGIPAKLVRRPDGRATIVTHGAYVADLVERLR